MDYGRGIVGNKRVQTMSKGDRDMNMASRCFWKDSRGRLWLVKDMSTEHLKSTLKYMKENAYSLRVKEDQGNSPILIFNRQWVKRTPIFQNIKKEYESRVK